MFVKVSACAPRYAWYSKRKWYAAIDNYAVSCIISNVVITNKNFTKQITRVSDMASKTKRRKSGLSFEFVETSDPRVSAFDGLLANG